MNPQIVSALITTILTIIAGGIGYLFREYRYRIKPFIAITEVAGEYAKFSSKVKVPSEIVEATENSSLFGKLDPEDYLQYVVQDSDTAKEIDDGAKEFIVLADKIIQAADTQSIAMLQSSLSKVFARRDYSDWIINLIAHGKIHFLPANKDLGKKVESYPSPGKEGCLWFSFPGLPPVSFGANFDKERMLKDKCQPFVELVEFMDMNGLKECFQQFKDCIESELLTAKYVRPIKAIVDENSMWLVRIYMANLGKTPFLISKDGTLHVDDSETKGKYEEPCNLALLTFKEDGSIKNISETTSPLVVGSEKSDQFVFVTTNVQGNMKLGSALREAFTRESAQCWVEFDIEKVGFSRHKRLKTPKAKFRATNKQ